MTNEQYTPKIPPRPLVPVALAFITGIIIADYKLLPDTLYYFLVLGLFVSFGLLYLTNKLNPIRLAIILLLCVGAGAVRLNAFYQTPANHINNFQAERVAVKLTGVVVDAPVITSQPETSQEKDEDSFTDFRWEQTRGWFIISAETISADVATAESRPKREGKTDKITGLVRVSFSNFTPEVKYGDRVEILGLIYSPPPPTNPGQFDYKKYLAQQGIYKSISLIKPEDLTLISSGNGNILLSPIYSLRQSLSKRIDGDFRSQPEQGILKALLLGERTNMPDDVEDRFLRSGTIHFLSVSGLHIVMVLAIFLWLLNLLGIRGQARAIILILITILYMALTGLNTPIVRAGIMAIVYFGAELFRRKSNSVNSLALSALVILIYKPTELFSIGFQLSFISVLAIIILTPEIMRLFPKEKNEALLGIIPQTFWEKGLRWLKRYLFGSIAVSLAAWLGSALMIIHPFHIITPISILANIALSLFVFIILSAGLVYLPFTALGLPLLFPGILSLLVGTTNSVLDFFIRIPLAYSYLPDIPLWIILSYYGIFCLWYLKPYLTHWTHFGKYLKGLSVVVILIVISWIIIVSIPLGLSRPKEMTVTMIDVRQGASFFIEFPDGRNMLYDAGNTGSFDVGKGTIAPFLWSKGITKIDKLILSHPHFDHINGVPALLERFRISEVIIADYWFENDSSGNGKKILSLIKPEMVKRVKRGEETLLAGGISGRVLGPPKWEEVETSNKAFKSNDPSMALQIKYQGKSLLLTGDIQSTGIQWLMESGESVQSDIMQIPHHGYKEPRISALIEVVRPKYVLLNASGTDISEELIQLCNDSGIKIFSSYEGGAITARFGDDGLILSGY